MLFNSYVFILLFLPVVLVGWFGMNHFGKYTAAKVFLILARPHDAKGNCGQDRNHDDHDQQLDEGKAFL